MSTDKRKPFWKKLPKVNWKYNPVDRLKTFDLGEKGKTPDNPSWKDRIFDRM